MDVIASREGHQQAEAVDRQAETRLSGLQAVLLDQRAALLRFLAARGAADEAEDVLHDLFVKLGRSVTAPVADPRAYLYRMADNLLLDRRRSAGRRTIRERAWTAEQLDVVSALDERPDAEQTLIQREQLALVSHALSALPERTLIIFRRFRIDGAGQKEIAAELAISLSAVEKHLQRAYRVLVEVQERLGAGQQLRQRP